MAAKKKLYEQKATTTKIAATSRVAVKIHDNYYTVEAHEERSLETVVNADINKEWEFLWNDLNTIVDNQVQDIVRTFTKK